MGVKEAMINAAKGLVELFSDVAAGQFGDIIGEIAAFVFRTPVPLNSSEPIYSFADPESGTIWASLFPFYEEIQIMVIAVFGLALGLTLTTGSFRSSAKTRKQIRRLAFYFPLAYWWWWIGGWFLKFNQAFTTSLVSGSYLTGLDGLFAVGLGSIFIVAVMYFFGLGAVFVVGAVYIARWFVIHVYMVVMPVLFSLKALPFKPIQGFADSLITKFFPLVLTTIPVAVLFRISAEVLSASSEIGGGSILTPIFAIMTLSLAAILPKLTFQFSGQIQRSIQSSSNVARGAAGQALSMAGAGGAAQQTLTGTRADPAAMDARSGAASGSSTSSGSSSGSSDSLMHEPDLDFTRHSRRRRQMKRGERGVKAAAKTGSLAQSAGKKAGSATKKSTLGAIGGAAKAHEKGKKSDIPTTTATAGAAAWQSGEAVKSKTKELGSKAAAGTIGRGKRKASKWEKRVRRRAEAARNSANSTVKQARREARESDGLGLESESESNTPEADVNTAPGEPAISDTYEAASWGAFDQLEYTETVDTAGTADSGLVASRNDTGMVDGVNEQRAEEIAGKFTDDIEAGNTVFESIDDVDEEAVRQAAHEYTDEDLGDAVAAQQAEYGVWDKFEDENPEWGETKRSPGGEINYAGSSASESSTAPADSGSTSTSDASESDPSSDPTTTSGSTTATDGDTTVGSVSQDQTYERNSSDTETGSFGGSTADTGSESPVDDGLSETEQAVREHLRVSDQSPDDVSAPRIAGKLRNKGRADGPKEVKDALDTLRDRDTDF